MSANRCADCGADWTPEQPLIDLDGWPLCELCWHAALDERELTGM